MHTFLCWQKEAQQQQGYDYEVSDKPCQWSVIWVCSSVSEASVTFLFVDYSRIVKDIIV